MNSYELYIEDVESGLGYCSAVSDGTVGKFGCGLLTRDGSGVCKCGSPTVPPPLSRYLGVLDGGELPKRPEYSAPGVMDSVRCIVDSIPAQEGNMRTLTHSELLAVEQVHGLPRVDGLLYFELVSSACRAQSSAYNQGLEYKSNAKKTLL